MDYSKRRKFDNTGFSGSCASESAESGTNKLTLKYTLVNSDKPNLSTAILYV